MENDAGHKRGHCAAISCVLLGNSETNGYSYQPCCQVGVPQNKQQVLLIKQDCISALTWASFLAYPAVKVRKLTR